MRKLSIFTFVLVIIITNNLFGKFVEIPDNSEKQLFECINSDKRLTELKFSLTGYERETIRQLADDEEYQKITYADEGFIAEEGMPDLPRITRLIAIPNESLVSIEIINIEKEILSDINIYPYQPDQGDIKSELRPFVKDFNFYDKDEVYPSKIVEIGKPAILRDIRVVNVTINPFQYNPKKRELHIIKNADIRVTYNENGIENIKTKERKLSRFFEPLYRSVIINYDEVLETKEYQHGSYLFIYPDNATIAAYLQYLTTWKHQKGFEVVAANTSQTGTSLGSIKNYIQNAYDTWSNPPEFICLVGDAGGSYNIPTGHYGYGEGDHYYTLLEGNDILADAFIGRLSFNSYPQLHTIINKILNYEKEPYMGSISWYRKALLVGDPSHSGPSCIIINKYIKELIQQNTGYYNFDEIYSSPFVSGMSNSINNGVCYFNYRGYLGMSGWSNSNTAALNNGYMLPFVVIPTCGTGDFEGTYDCESEYFLKAGSASIPKGAIGAVGTATMDTHTSLNNFMSSGIFYGIFFDQIYSMGGAVVRGKVNLYNCFPNNPNNWVDKKSYWNNLMGDPGMELWTDVPMQMNVFYDSQVPIGSNYLEVTVNSIFGFPMEGAWVTALKGNDEIFATGYTDVDGKVFLPISASSSGSVNLTVTKHNFIPHLGSFNIAEETYFANILDYIIDDDNSGSSSGNGDGAINPGEDIELKVRIKNYGTVTLNSVSATISINPSASGWVTITDSIENYGNIPSNSSAYSSDDFDFSVDPACLGGTELQFDLLIEDGSSHQWNDILYLYVEGPNLYAKNYSVIDGNNGILDPGETAEVVVTIRNIGSVVANDITGFLSCSDTSITITDSIGYFGNILPDNEVTNNSDRFEITADTQIIPGTQFSLKLHLSNLPASGYNNEVSFNFEVGEVFVTDPLGPDEYGYYCYDSGDTEYDIAPIYSWIEIDPNYGGSGTVIPLYDSGNTGDIEIIDLPFSFRFYGKTYDIITVCSNGWIAPGETEQYAFMNSPLPGPQGPSPMIAPFWDDLRIGGGRVCYYENTSSHYFVIEWSHLQNDYNSAEETFQVILFDPTYYQTPTGDGEILMQYKVVNNVNQGNYSGWPLQHGEYSTVGLENSYGTIGLEYTFCNQYPTAAKPLENHLALFFTTQGSGVLDPPEANFTPEEFNFILEPGESIIDTLSISNSGPSNLMFSITKDYHLFRDSGGPDSYGYIWKDSDETNGPEYDWIDISEIGTELSFTHNDYAVGPFDIGFDFDFYGETYIEFIVSPNGWIGFGDDWTDWHNFTIPRVDAPRPAIFGFWDDLDPIQSGSVYYYSNGIDSLIVSYIDVMHFPGMNNGTYNFQIIITSNDRIKFNYRSVLGDINSSTIGIQNANGTIGLQVAYNENYVHDSLAVEFIRQIDWLTLSTNNGIVLPGNTQDIYLNVSTDELDNGIYLCDLIITTNDPFHSLETIPVNLTVTQGDFGYVEGNVILIGGSGNVEDVEIYIGSLLVHPDEYGHFDASILPGIYILTATLEGYDTFTTEIEVIANETTLVEIILQYIEAPSAIWVELSEYYTADIFWNNITLSKDSLYRVFQSYTLLRKYDEEDWQIITEGLIDTTYSDSLLFEPDGDYKYGVKAIFETGQTEITESEPFNLFRFVDIAFNLSLSNGAAPVSIYLTMTGLDSIYSQSFSDTTDVSGVLHFADVFMTDYSIEINKDGYISIIDTITISVDTTEFWYVLQEQISSFTGNTIPHTYAISQNYPNPFHCGSNRVSGTKICYQLPKFSGVRIYIYNIRGEKIRSLIDEKKEPGYYEVTWNGRDDNNKTLSSGIYFYKLQVGNKVIDTKKCLILR